MDRGVRIDEKTFSDAVALLSGQHSLPILRYLSTGEWRIASDVSRALDIHTTTASKFLGGMHRLGFLERRVRRSRTRSAYEYRLPADRITLDLEFTSGPEPLREALDFYLDYVANVLAKARRLGWPGIGDRLESRLGGDRVGLKENLFTRILNGGGARGMDQLKSLFREIHGDFLAITSESLGRSTARRILSGALEEAQKGREDLVGRYGLQSVLEG